MDKFDLELIQKELNKKDYKIVKPIKITKGLIDKLMNEYNTCSYYELYYDDEPDISDEEWDKLGTTDDEKEKKFKEICNNIDNTKRRKQFNNWTDPYEWGIWGWTNHKVRKEARRSLNEIKQQSYEEGRCYYLEYDKGVKLYFYGRDLPEQCDYCFYFYNEEETPCTKCRKNKCWVGKCKRNK